MKKFLSLALSLAMLLSSVSFAAPGTVEVETAEEYVEAEMPALAEEDASLLAEEGTTTVEEKLHPIFSVDFNPGDFSKRFDANSWSGIAKYDGTATDMKDSDGTTYTKFKINTTDETKLRDLQSEYKIEVPYKNVSNYYFYAENIAKIVFRTRAVKDVHPDGKENDGEQCRFQAQIVTDATTDPVTRGWYVTYNDRDNACVTPTNNWRENSKTIDTTGKVDTGFLLKLFRYAGTGSELDVDYVHLVLKDDVALINRKPTLTTADGKSIFNYVSGDIIATFDAPMAGLSADEFKTLFLPGAAEKVTVTTTDYKVYTVSATDNNLGGTNFVFEKYKEIDGAIFQTDAAQTIKVTRNHPLVSVDFNDASDYDKYFETFSAGNVELLKENGVSFARFANNKQTSGHLNAVFKNSIYTGNIATIEFRARRQDDINVNQMGVYSNDIHSDKKFTDDNKVSAWDIGWMGNPGKDVWTLHTKNNSYTIHGYTNNLQFILRYNCQPGAIVDVDYIKFVLKPTVKVVTGTPKVATTDNINYTVTYSDDIGLSGAEFYTEVLGSSDKVKVDSVKKTADGGYTFEVISDGTVEIKPCYNEIQDLIANVSGTSFEATLPVIKSETEYAAIRDLTIYDETESNDKNQGMRFMAAVSNSKVLAEVENGAADYGFIVARSSVLGEAELTKNFTGKKIEASAVGKNFEKFDDVYSYFTCVLYGIPVKYYDDNLVCRPYAVINGEYVYGAPIENSIYKVAKAILSTEHDNATAEQVVKYYDDYKATQTSSN